MKQSLKEDSEEIVTTHEIIKQRLQQYSTMNYVTEEDKKTRYIKNETFKTKLQEERKKLDDMAEEFKVLTQGK